MTTTNKAIRRARKLVDLACSTGPQGERESAALEAAKVIAEHKLAIGPPESEPVTKMPDPVAPIAAAKRSTFASWTSATAPADGFCTACSGPIQKGDRIWYRPGVAMHDWPCYLDVD